MTGLRRLEADLKIAIKEKEIAIDHWHWSCHMNASRIDPIPMLKAHEKVRQIEELIMAVKAKMAKKASKARKTAKPQSVKRAKVAKPVDFILFVGEDCPYCPRAKQACAEVNGALGVGDSGPIKIVNCDESDATDALATKHEIYAIPTLIALRGKNEIARVSGPMKAKDVIKFMQSATKGA